MNIRPPWDQFRASIGAWPICSCGDTLSEGAVREHWQLGHFDTWAPDPAPTLLTEAQGEHVVHVFGQILLLLERQLGHFEDSAIAKAMCREHYMLLCPKCLGGAIKR